MNNPQVDTVYKTYIDAYQAAANLKKQDAGVDTVVRIEKAPYSDGYVVRSTPVVLEMALLKCGMKMPGAFFPAFTPARSGFGDKN